MSSFFSPSIGPVPCYLYPDRTLIVNFVPRPLSLCILKCLEFADVRGKMERFLSNYKPPPPKKSKLSEEEQLEKNRKYETEKRKRAFNPSWKNTFGWLDYHVVNGEGKMFCSICRRYDHANTFSVGNSNR